MLTTCGSAPVPTFPFPYTACPTLSTPLGIFWLAWIDLETCLLAIMSFHSFFFFFFFLKKQKQNQNRTNPKCPDHCVWLIYLRLESGMNQGWREVGPFCSVRGRCEPKALSLRFLPRHPQPAVLLSQWGFGGQGSQTAALASESGTQRSWDITWRLHRMSSQLGLFRWAWRCQSALGGLDRW